MESWLLNRHGQIRKRLKKGTRMSKNIRNWNYEERLHYLDLPSLSYWQFRGDMLTSYQKLNGFVDAEVTILNFLIYVSTITNTRGHSCRLYKRYAGYDVRKRYFSNTIINKWNNLPSYFIEATTINDFKNKFDNYFKDLVIVLIWTYV